MDTELGFRVEEEMMKTRRIVDVEWKINCTSLEQSLLDSCPTCLLVAS